MVDLRAYTERDTRIVKIEETSILDEMFARTVGERLGKIARNMTESNLLINMSNVKFLASSMIGQLVIVRETCAQRNIKLALCNLREQIGDALAIANIDEIINVFPSEAAAIAALAGDEAPNHENPNHENPSHENPSHENPSHENPSHENPSHENPSDEPSCDTPPTDGISGDGISSDGIR